MKRFLFVCAVTFTLMSCGGGKHEAEVMDSRLQHPDSADSPRIVTGTTDSTHGASAGARDTAGSARRNR